jgi:hypothetical protein
VLFAIPLSDLKSSPTPSLKKKGLSQLFPIISPSFSKRGIKGVI